MKTLDGKGLRPVLHSFHLGAVHLDTFRRDDVLEKLGGRLVKLKFLKLQIQMIFLKPVEGLSYITDMFSEVGGVNEDVIYIDNDKSV